MPILLIGVPWSPFLWYATLRKTPADLNPCDRQQVAQLWQRLETRPAGRL